MTKYKEYVISDENGYVTNFTIDDVNGPEFRDEKIKEALKNGKNSKTFEKFFELESVRGNRHVQATILANELLSYEGVHSLFKNIEMIGNSDNKKMGYDALTWESFTSIQKGIKDRVNEDMGNGVFSYILNENGNHWVSVTFIPYDNNKIGIVYSDSNFNSDEGKLRKIKEALKGLYSECDISIVDMSKEPDFFKRNGFYTCGLQAVFSSNAIKLAYEQNKKGFINALENGNTGKISELCDNAVDKFVEEKKEIDYIAELCNNEIDKFVEEESVLSKLPVKLRFKLCRKQQNALVNNQLEQLDTSLNNQNTSLNNQNTSLNNQNTSLSSKFHSNALRASRAKSNVREMRQTIQDINAGRCSVVEASEKLNVKPITIRRWIKHYEIYKEDFFSTSPKSYPDDIKEKAVQAYLNKEGSQREICARFKIKSVKSLIRWINESKNNNKCSAKKEFKPIEKLKIVEDMYKNGMTMSETIKKYSLEDSVLQTWCRLYEIDGRKAFIRKKPKQYPDDVKKQAVLDHMIKKISRHKICINYKIRSTSSLERWEKMYKANNKCFD